MQPVTDSSWEAGMVPADASGANPSWRGVEQLESRLMLSVSMDSAGWTVIDPSDDTRIIYVSHSQGSDNNRGLAADEAVKTLEQAKSLVRDGMPDWILLRRGDSWDGTLGKWTKSGRSEDEPIVIGSYGQLDARPLLRTGSDDGVWTLPQHEVSHVVIQGLHFHAHTRDLDSPDFSSSSGGTGIDWHASGEGLLIEDVVVESYVTNFTIQSRDGFDDFTLRRSQVLDSYAISGRSQGMFVKNIDGILLEENLFDHNGWNEHIADAERTIYNHNIYIQADATDLVVRGNVLSNASSHGLQARSGGVIEDNLFIGNALGMSFGLVLGAVDPLKDGVSGIVSGNVFMESNDISSDKPRGIGMELGNVSSATVIDNLFLNDDSAASNAISFKGNNGIGIKNLLLAENISYNWRGGYEFKDGNYQNITIQDNVLQQFDTTTALITYHGAFNSSQFDCWENIYYSHRHVSDWMRIGGQEQSFDQWMAISGETGSNLQTTFADPTRTVESYHAMFGGTGGLDGFMNQLRSYDQGAWNASYSADAVSSYLKDGFVQDDLSYESRPEVGVVVADQASKEGQAERFTFMRSGDLTAPLTVEYIANGSAAGGVDYQALSDSITLGTGELSTTVDVLAVDDQLFEGDEQLTISITSGPEYLVGSAHSATMTISDNNVATPVDDPPVDDLEPAGPEIDIADSSGDPDNLTLGWGIFDVEVGQLSSQGFFTVHNRGGSDLEIRNMRLEGQAADDFIYTVLDEAGNQLIDSTFSVGAGEHIQIGVHFEPTTTGDRSGVIRFESNAHDDESVELDLHGTAIGDVVPVSGKPSDPAVMIDSRHRKMVIADAHGRDVNFELTGNGTAQVVVGDDGFSKLVFNGTNARSRLRINAGWAGTTITDVMINGSLGSLEGPSVDLLGDLRVTGTLGRLHLDDVVGAQQTICMESAISVNSRFTFDQVSDLDIKSSGNIRLIRATEWIDGDSQGDLIHARSLKSLQITGDRGRDMAGDFEADLTLDGDADMTLLGSARIAGNIVGAQWWIDGRGGSASVGGKVTDFELHSGGDFGTLRVGSAQNVQVDVDGRIRTLWAGKWQGGSVEADRVSKLMTSRRGDFDADMTLHGQDGQHSLTLARIGGELVSGDWKIDGAVRRIQVGSSGSGWNASINGGLSRLAVSGEAGGSVSARSIEVLQVGRDMRKFELDLVGHQRGRSLGKMRVGGMMEDSHVNAAGRIDTVTVAGLHQSSIFSGVLGETGRLLISTDDFDALSSIGKMHIGGSGRVSVLNSTVGAARVGHLHVGGTSNGDPGLDVISGHVGRLTHPNKGSSNYDVTVRIV